MDDKIKYWGVALLIIFFCSIFIFEQIGSDDIIFKIYIILFCFLLASLLFYRAYLNRIVIIYGKELPTSTVRALAIGPVEVKGKITAKQPLKMPFSNRDGVAYKTLILLENKKQKQSFYHWGSKSIPFVLKDATGSVDIRGNYIFAENHPRYKVKFTDKSMPDHLRAYFKKYKLPIRRGIYHFQEWSLFTDDQVYILGNATTKKQASYQRSGVVNLQIGNFIGKRIFISTRAEFTFLKKLKQQNFYYIPIGILSAVIGIGLTLIL